MPAACGVIGSPLRQSPSPVSRPGRDISTDRPLASIESSFILPAPISSSEFLRHSLPLRALRPELTARVLGPLHDITGRVHQSRGSPGPRSVPSSGYRNLATSFSALRLAGLFRPAAMSRVHTVQGLCFPRAAVHPRRVSFYPHAVAPHCAHLARAKWPRNKALGFEVLLRARMRTIVAVFNRHGSRSPPRFPSPPGAQFPGREPWLPRVIRS